MNLIDVVGSNYFLKVIFPDGLTNPVLLGEVRLGEGSRISMSIHTHQEPHKKIDKWGVWGESYNTIAIKITGQLIDKLNISNWQNNRVCNLVVTENENNISLIFQGKGFEMQLELKCMLFQYCKTYIDTEPYEEDE